MNHETKPPLLSSINRKRARCHLAALAAYSLLTLVLTFPLPGTMNQALAGRSSDVYINPWADWWTKKALGEGLDFYYTDYMFYPRGTSLVFHSFSHTNTLISLLLAPWVGRLAAYNFTVLLTYALSGFNMYLLASYLTKCPPAAFVAGFVFAFYPGHMFESAHPVLGTTQWIPLFVLALIKMLYDTGGGWIKQSLLAAWWFLLTALSSWHLMIMLTMWMALYLLYNFSFERAQLAPTASRSLLLLAIATALLLAPFLWPIIQEQLTEDTAYMAVDTEVGLGNDLLAFLVPNQGHPAFSSYFADFYKAIGLSKKRPAYLGYVPLILAASGIITAWRKTHFWLPTGLIFLVLSLGAKVTVAGTPLHTFDFPWAIPIISVLRHPFRFNVFLFFSLAVLVGFGGRWLYHWIAARNKSLAHLAFVSIAGLILFEYLVFPFPTTQLEPNSPFFSQLAEEEGDFAVADFPMGRKQAKYYLFYQTIHGKKMVDGVVSRTPDDAYAFVDANPLLGPMHAGTAPDPDLDIEQQFADLAAQDIRYIIIHKDRLKSYDLEDWRRWLAYFPPPFYQNNLLVVYATYLETRPEIEPVYELEAKSVAPVEITQGGGLFINLHWSSSLPSRPDLSVCLALLDAGGNVSQETCDNPIDDWVASKEFTNAVNIADYVFQVDPHLPGGEYTLTTRLVESETRQVVAETRVLETITVTELAREFDIPTPQHVTSARFGQDLRFLGYDATQDASELHLTLYWQAERQISHYYKFFVYLFAEDTLEIVAQADVVPRDWTYPTTWWEAGEVVSDNILLALSDVPPGTYRLGIGVYKPDTGERLPVINAAGEYLSENQIILPGEFTR